jgi:hypothetical protein
MFFRAIGDGGFITAAWFATRKLDFWPSKMARRVAIQLLCKALIKL